MATRRTSRSSDALRRKRVWCRQDSDFLAVSSVGTAARMDLDFTTELGTDRLPVGATFGGAKLDFVVNRDTAAAAGNEIRGVHFGLLVSDRNVEADVPRPVDDMHVDWIYKAFVPLPVAVDTPVSSFDALGGSITIRSKRKIAELGMNLWFVVQGDLVGDDIDARIMLSSLLLLP